ncbi:hypothetical protein GW813_11095 [bacterium]|nr:hypothetical protein [bacterium]PIV82008.1 MAG: hypothetical protein COW53_01225 [bacterium CG17_big_fil_post_rev_8_21_14_2_50_64_8]PJA76275.1 MAG: hypothetical protein CO151_03345 [bacterium CG_4_9_14_3_um_filter_65_15]
MTRIAGALLLLALGLGGMTACNDTGDSGAKSGRAGADCPLAVDTEGWRVFRTLGDRIMSDDTPTMEELKGFGNTTAARTWRHSMRPANLTSGNLGNWIFAAFPDELGEQKLDKPMSYRASMSSSYRFSYDQRATIDSMLAVVTNPDTLCNLYHRLQAWVEPDSLPAEVALTFLPAKASLVFYSDTLLVDTGVLAAGGVRQTFNQILGSGYRNFEVPYNKNPLECQGAEAVVESWRRIRGDGIAAYLEGRSDTYFGNQHPKLKGFSILPVDIIQAADKLANLSEATLAKVLVDSTTLATSGSGYARAIFAGGGFDQLGYAMAATIAGNLGRDQLRQAAFRTRDFVTAYQAAAASNPVPRPEPGAADYPWYASMRPLPPQVFADLVQLLDREGR